MPFHFSRINVDCSHCSFALQSFIFHFYYLVVQHLIHVLGLSIVSTIIIQSCCLTAFIGFASQSSIIIHYFLNFTILGTSTIHTFFLGILLEACISMSNIFCNDLYNLKCNYTNSESIL